MELSANPSTRWMSIFVDELAHNGLQAVCIAPGSRSTPLTLAFANQPAIRIFRHLDERSAGFFALGLAKATDKPVALVCTSGTAAANFHPAVIEAYYAHVPLLVLTADRPAELRGSGANQTIDQIKMYGDHVRWSVDVPTPDSGSPEITLRHVRTLAARAYATANGLTKGPVHLNFPFRKPLEPESPVGEDNGLIRASTDLEPEPYTQISRGRIWPDERQTADIAGVIATHVRGLIICGPDCPGGDFPSSVASLAEACGYPVLADPLSNVRHGRHVENGYVLGGYHLWLSTVGDDIGHPDVILRFGSVPTSAALAAYLDRIRPAAHIHIRENGEWADDLHRTSRLIQANEAAFCTQLTEHLAAEKHQPDRGWADGLRMIEEQTWNAVEEVLSDTAFFDGTAVRQTLDSITDGALLFAGNSMPVRHVDTFDQPSTKLLTVSGNRGASGIDGNVSTALGIAATTSRRVTAILGDITFYHDMNGLLAVRQYSLKNITFVVVNNDGGGIFHRLPVARHDPPFTELFLTPHGLTFDHAAAMYGLRYALVRSEAELEKALQSAGAPGAEACLIEVTTNSYVDYQHMRSLAAAVAAKLQPTRART